MSSGNDGDVSDTGTVPSATPASAAVEPNDEDPLVGRVLVDRYKIERRLGEGGMGAVYLARHTTLEKQVALKVLHGEFSRKKDLVERFLQEARAASRIRHENVIDITDFGSTEDGYVFFAMELLEGRDLHEALSRAKLDGEVLPWARSRTIFLQVCAALEAAHGQGIVHRDLKPENIYLVEWYGHQDFVKLLDFGIAKMTAEVGKDGRKLTKTGMLFGTPEYMSPEQARGEKADLRVDIYAMGCILYQLLTGDVPFDAENFMGILTQHLSAEVPPIGEKLADSGAPLGIEAVVMKALAKDREERFQSIHEFAEAVRAVSGRARTAPVEDGAPIARKRTQWTGSVQLPEPDTTERERPSRGAPMLIGGALLLALLIGGGAFMLTRNGDDAAATVTDAGLGQVLVEADARAAGSTAALETVRVTIQSTPAGAEIRDANGKVLGKTPHALEDKKDAPRRSVTLFLQGHAPLAFDVEFGASETYRHTLTLDNARAEVKGNNRGKKPTDSGKKPTDSGKKPTDSGKKPPKCDPKINADCNRLKTTFPQE